MLPWAVSGLALLIAVSAIAMVRRVSRRLDGVTRSYWELRYEYTRLRSRLSRLDPEEPAPEPPAAPAPSASFIPLSTIRKKEQ